MKFVTFTLLSRYKDQKLDKTHETLRGFTHENF